MKNKTRDILRDLERTKENLLSPGPGISSLG